MDPIVAPLIIIAKFNQKRYDILMISIILSILSSIILLMEL